MRTVLAILTGFVLDLLIGDPHFIPHPVSAMGWEIAHLEQCLRRRFPKTPAGERSAGLLLWIGMAVQCWLIPAGVLYGCGLVHPVLQWLVESVMCWQILAVKSLRVEAMKVHAALKKGTLEDARQAVSMIVGRDTAKLDRDGVIRAAVETVAENTSDGVIAPLFWMGLFGAAGGFFYKSVNTMDSMIGYKNEKYLFFGRAAAKLDDAVNFLPARLSALLMIAVCPLLGLDTGGALRIFRRDRRKHESPNSAQTESVCAGALGLRLAGDAFYGGVLHKKPFIGDPARMIEPRDIERAGRLMYMASFAMLLLVTILRGAVIVCI